MLIIPLPAFVAGAVPPGFNVTGDPAFGDDEGVGVIVVVAEPGAPIDGSDVL